MADWHDGQDAVLLAVLRHHADALPNRIARRADLQFPAFKEHLAIMSARPDAEQAGHQFRPPRAYQSCNAEDFTAPKRERDVIDHLAVGIGHIPAIDIARLEND